MTNSATLLSLLLCVVMLGTACRTNHQYRTDYSPYNQADPAADPSNKAVIETTPDYALGFVEFDEEGWFWDTNQVKAIEGVIRTEAGVDQTNNPAGIVILVFVHGWKNNASYNCTNVEMFRQTLSQVNLAEQTQSADNHRPARKVVGVYCGWRGLSATCEPFKELSMWNRKETAHKVGGYGAMTRLFVELEQLQSASNAHIPDGSRTELIIIGHSFGGAAVYSAISQFVTERFVDDVEQGIPLKPLGDQVILLNPAFEASRHYDLNELAVKIDKYPESQRPVLSIFTSEGDWATHYLLPIGRFFPTMFESVRGSNPRAATRQAVGWFDPFITHHLAYNTNAVLGATDHTTYNSQSHQHELHRSMDKLRKSVDNVHVQRQKWHPNAPVPATYYFDDCVLEPKPTFRPGDPFLVVSVDKKIMKDHDDITNPVLINFLREYIQFCHK